MITLSMIVKNEEKYLRDCLISVQGVVDEIVIVDTGSTDSTLKIAEEFGAKIFHFEWINDFAAARNYALRNSTKEWILYLDADERLEPESKRELIKIGRTKNNVAYFCNLKNLDSHYDKPSIMAYPRFFPNKKELYFEGKVHEQIAPSLSRNNIPTKNSSLKLLHIGYDIPKDKLIEKAERNLKLLLEDYTVKETSYIAFQIGQTYTLLDEEEKTLFYFDKALQGNDLTKEYKAIMLRYISVTEVNKGNLAEAIRLIELSLKEDPAQVFTILAAAKIYQQSKQIDKVFLLYKKAYELNIITAANKLVSAQANFFSPKLLIYDALTVSVVTNNKDMFNYFYSELKKMSQQVIIKEIIFIEKLFNNTEIDLDEWNANLNLVNEGNLKFIAAVISNYSGKIKSEMFERLVENFPKSSEVLTNYGIYLISQKEYEKAKNIYEKILLLKPEDYSFIFYLISIYINLNEFDSIISLISNSTDIYGKNSLFNNKINLVTEKLKAANLK